MSDMTWPKLVLLAWYALSFAATLTMIGRERRPLTAGQAALMFVVLLGICALVVIA